MAEYKITRVSQEPPREWNNPRGGVIYYKKVMLEDYPKPVSIGKKSADALQVGQTVYGTIEKTDLPEDKWHAEQNPNFSGGSGGGQGGSAPRREYVDHHEDIKAQWSIGQAVSALKSDGKAPNGDLIEDWAARFYAMVERVKVAGKGQKPAPPVTDEFGPQPPETTMPFEGEEIPLDQIPF